MTNIQPICIYCERTSDQVPLLVLRYQGAEMCICPQHLPILIHQPARLADKLPGAENLAPPEEHHHHD
jgi:hypothetical protein